MKEFTMSEYIEANKLGVSPHDPTATRMISAKLKSLGFTRRRVKRDGKFQVVWSDEPRPDYEALQNKLDSLQR